ncbi:NapC/NirT family cytochrome c [Pseudodesulfovibrio senegalensis]|jgi:cytochrome c-type protein NapC/trimethylamine-N-oxide reductase cytochrome c-type subunit TorC|uniref:Cytochrome C n=1 Tax=Pseudodesulfovibrio senegalensis TaxID=1721087 RepID=A0A6N6N548_9BACT|nr:NapC/NirT family cytochrome c [Pseudodesulfovibrio senegalensis]KAB1443013.1 cytochrome C [Pseudodesulfovibrio senegalensis]
MKRGTKTILLVGLGILIAFPLFSMTYYTMVRTSTPGFCSSCHEIRPAFLAWQASTHANNAQGVVADCMDCHLPAPHDTVDFFFSKTFHGIKDVVSHFTGGAENYDRAVMRQRVYDTLDNDQCMKCHRNILHLPGSRGAMLAHRQVLYPRPGYEYRCTDCHSNLVHVDRTYYKYKQFSAPYVAPGLASF